VSMDSSVGIFYWISEFEATRRISDSNCAFKIGRVTRDAQCPASDRNVNGRSGPCAHPPIRPSAWPPKATAKSANMPSPTAPQNSNNSSNNNSNNNNSNNNSNSNHENDDELLNRFLLRFQIDFIRVDRKSNRISATVTTATTATTAATAATI